MQIHKILKKKLFENIKVRILLIKYSLASVCRMWLTQGMKLMLNKATIRVILHEYETWTVKTMYI